MNMVQPARIAPVCIAAVSLALFSWLTSHPYFVDPDTFYHIGVARQMAATHKLAIDFTALPLTTLTHAFADQAWLYHVLLIPFLSLFGTAVGIKACTTLLSLAVIMSVYVIAQRWRAPLPWIYPLVLLLSAPFIFRLALGKPSALAVLLLLWGIYALIEKNIGCLPY